MVQVLRADHRQRTGRNTSRSHNPEQQRQQAQRHNDCGADHHKAHSEQASRSRVYVRGKLWSAAELKHNARTNPRTGQIAADRLCRQDQRLHDGRGRPRAKNQRRFEFEI